MINHSKVNYFENGDINGEIILFLHPKNLSPWIWNNQIDAFDNYHCFYIDLENRTIEENTDLIGDFIENKLKCEIFLNDKNTSKINLVGIEFGGQIAIELLNKYPNNINKVFLSGINFSNSNYLEEFDFDKIFAKTKKEYLDKKSERFLAKAYLREFGISKEYYEEMKESLDEKEFKEQYIFPLLKENNILDFNLKDNLEKNNFNINNILINYGTKEDLTTQISAIKLKSLLKEARLIEIEKGLLLWNMSKSDLFNKILKEFLEE